MSQNIFECWCFARVFLGIHVGGNILKVYSSFRNILWSCVGLKSTLSLSYEILSLLYQTFWLVFVMFLCLTFINAYQMKWKVCSMFFRLFFIIQLTDVVVDQQFLIVTNDALICFDLCLIWRIFMFYWFKHLIKISGCWNFSLTLVLCMLWVNFLFRPITYIGQLLSTFLNIHDTQFLSILSPSSFLGVVFLF